MSQRVLVSLALVSRPSLLILLYSPPGRLLDATHQYKYVFLLAGCEVTLSALVLALGNFFCLSRKPKDSDAKTETGATAAEKEDLNRQVEAGEAAGGEEETKENGKVNALKGAETAAGVQEAGVEGEENTETSL